MSDEIKKHIEDARYKIDLHILNADKALQQPIVRDMAELNIYYQGRLNALQTARELISWED